VTGPTVPLASQVDRNDYRRVLGCYATGVTVLTAQRPEGPVGMACNSLTSVSLDPPLIAVCPAKTSKTWPAIRDVGRFVANVMAADHAEHVRTFARTCEDRFAATRWHRRGCGPALDEALAWIECELLDEHDAGDHTIAVARVVALDGPRDADPLVFFRSRYGTFAEHA
jgi:3-hydroxy-9,10-secoandrosta-1,3,5(10)-triene-9,17-dione monooxygenase reductase component